MLIILKRLNGKVVDAEELVSFLIGCIEREKHYDPISRMCYESVIDFVMSHAYSIYRQ